MDILKSLVPDRKMIITLVTMTVIAFIIGYYLLFYVKGREEDFVEKKFRILDLIGKNLVEKKKNLELLNVA